MTDQTGSDFSPVARSFADHLRSFHAGLPADEQKLLEKVFAMAEATAARGEDVQGYAVIDFFLKLDDVPNAAATGGQPSKLWPQLSGPPAGGFTGGVHG